MDHKIRRDIQKFEMSVAAMAMQYCCMCDGLRGIVMNLHQIVRCIAQSLQYERFRNWNWFL